MISCKVVCLYHTHADSKYHHESLTEPLNGCSRTWSTLSFTHCLEMRRQGAAAAKQQVDIHVHTRTRTRRVRNHAHTLTEDLCVQR